MSDASLGVVHLCKIAEQLLRFVESRGEQCQSVLSWMALHPRAFEMQSVAEPGNEGRVAAFKHQTPPETFPTNARCTSCSAYNATGRNSTEPTYALNHVSVRASHTFEVVWCRLLMLCRCAHVDYTSILDSTILPIDIHLQYLHDSAKDTSEMPA